MAINYDQLERELRAYADGRRSAADDDRLRQSVRDAAVGTTVSVSGRDWSNTDRCVKTKSLAMTKPGDDAWTVAEHWFNAPGDVVSDAVAAHGLRVALGFTRPVIACRDAHGR